MKKILVCILVLCTIIFVSCQKSVENPLIEITETEAIELAKSHIESTEHEDYIKLIPNFDTPTVEKLDFDTSYSVYTFNDDSIQENNLKGKQVWKIIYTTTLDPFLGSHIIYIDRYSGKIYGTDLRM